MNLAPYSKSLAAVIGSAVTTAVTYYPHASWIPIISAILTALSVYAIPNTTKRNSSVNDPVVTSTLTPAKKADDNLYTTE